MGEWMGRRVEVLLSGQYHLDRRLGEAQTRALLEAFDAYETFDHPCLSCLPT